MKFARFAHVANDGTIAFSYQDDIWVANGDGANARRLTAHVARDFAPRFSPDGSWIAFTSNRNGNNDVYVVAAAGGEPRQLTYHSGDDQALYWAPDGRSMLAVGERTDHQCRAKHRAVRSQQKPGQFAERADGRLAWPDVRRGVAMSVIFLILPLALGIVAIAVAAFVWATRRGQYGDLETPAIRAVQDD